MIAEDWKELARKLEKEKKRVSEKKGASGDAPKA